MGDFVNVVLASADNTKGSIPKLAKQSALVISCFDVFILVYWVNLNRSIIPFYLPGDTNKAILHLNEAGEQSCSCSLGCCMQSSTVPFRSTSYRSESFGFKEIKVAPPHLFKVPNLPTVGKNFVSLLFNLLLLMMSNNLLAAGLLIPTFSKSSDWTYSKCCILDTCSSSLIRTKNCSS